MAQSVRQKLAGILRREIKRRGWSQNEAARELGTFQSRISVLMAGQSDLSIETTIEYLEHLGHKVVIHVSD